ncbi:unnamed protein product [Fusarium graminearum]|uniref:Chromosome 4, complete genome n=1 Tax=Gibberella zeae (strain ATCC MYA-4620 / CBS 123657 / FGSC 9075 / NRRL 31084 / PH-1) TaxID=229533 RepID=I1S8C4_GIBZE|nr:hypothetical protein FGSG_13102 [Fusarium graminearum PH-1]ESU13460.1 hypothetical protein FGSG_13102 [Fusarium graminearum PH-1]CEF84964.1 unnamed protein product [Fusarium graminearum]CZS73066.1 unnamed protein product [Fusarium graminearum]|eukprot:XP_011326967.1 hypothetical protein FGSG_13102 [Fusarium graminearum PH-1]
MEVKKLSPNSQNALTDTKRENLTMDIEAKDGLRCDGGNSKESPEILEGRSQARSVGSAGGEQEGRRDGAARRASEGAMNEWGAPNANLPVKGSRLSIRERLLLCLRKLSRVESQIDSSESSQAGCRY